MFFLIFSWISRVVIANWKRLTSLPFWICFFFVFYPFRKIYVWSTTVKTYCMALIEHSVNIIEYKTLTLHWLFSTHLILIYLSSKVPVFYIVIFGYVCCYYFCFKELHNFSLTLFVDFFTDTKRLWTNHAIHVKHFLIIVYFLPFHFLEIHPQVYIT